jgi:hypothetical protein
MITGRKILLILLLFSYLPVKSQSMLFRVYPDSLSLAQDAASLFEDFFARVKAAEPNLNLEVKPRVQTTPNFVFYGRMDNVLVLPLWHKAQDSQKEFFTRLGGSYIEGIRIFGMLYNGYFIIHELSTVLQIEKGIIDWARIYEMRYQANQLSIAYLKSSRWAAEMEAVYNLAKTFVSLMPFPIPAGQNIPEYFSENYPHISNHPMKYLYFQFLQIVEIYEDQELQGFENMVRQYFLQTKL